MKAAKLNNFNHRQSLLAFIMDIFYHLVLNNLAMRKYLLLSIFDALVEFIQ